MLRLNVLLLIGLAFLAGFYTSAQAERRVALVIGNSDYAHATPLKNPRNDAKAISARLKELGFDVVTGTNLKHREFARIIGSFKRKLETSGIAVFFYAGHGIQVNGRNYLVPVDAELDDETSLDFEAVQLNTILRLMERRQRINIVLLDACRDNPMARNLSRSMGTRSTAVGRGLAPVESGIGTLISYATQPGNIALDGDQGNSPFTRSLMKHIATPELDIALMMRRVRQDVITETGGRQIPWQHSSLTAPFMFNAQNKAEPVPQREAKPAQNERTSPRSLSSFAAIELAFWQSAKDQGTREAYAAYIQKFPDGNFTLLAEIKLKEFERNASANTKQKIPKTIPAGKSDISAQRQIEIEQAARKRIEAQDEKKQRLASLQPESQPGEPENLSPKVMVMVLQNELKRAGCNPGKVDGKWGRKGSEALNRFNKYAKRTLPTNNPSMEAIEAIRSYKQRICPKTIQEKTRKARLKLRNKVKDKVKNNRGNKKTATKKPARSRSSGKKCKYEPLGACADRVCDILGTKGGCPFVNTAGYCKKGSKWRKKICK